MAANRAVAAVVALVFLAGALPAWGDDVTPQDPAASILRKGQPAPYDGELLNTAAIIKMVQELRAAKERAAVIETLEAENKLREEQNKFLTNAAGIAEQMAAIAQKNAADNSAVLQQLGKVIDHNGEILKQNQEVIASNVKVIESMQKEIENLRKERRWAMIAGPIGLGVGLLLGHFGGFLLPH